MPKLTFREWLMAEGTQIGMDPDELAMMRACFQRGFDKTAILVYADWLDEHAERGGSVDVPRLTACMRLIADGSKTGWCGDLKVLQSYACHQREGIWTINDHHRNTLFFVPGNKGHLYPYMEPNESCYRLSLNSAQWSVYTNHLDPTDPAQPAYRRIYVVTGRDKNDQARYQYTGNSGEDRITHRDMTPVSPQDVPDKLIVMGYWEVIDWMTHRRR